MLEQAIRAKIQDLVRRSDALTSGGRLRDAGHIGLCQGWITEAMNIIELAVPIENNSYRRQITKIGDGGGEFIADVASIAAILRAVLPDIDAGLIADFGNTIRAETFDDFLEHLTPTGKKAESKLPVCWRVLYSRTRSVAFVGIRA